MSKKVKLFKPTIFSKMIEVKSENDSGLCEDLYIRKYDFEKLSAEYNSIIIINDSLLKRIQKIQEKIKKKEKDNIDYKNNVKDLLYLFVKTMSKEDFTHLIAKVYNIEDCRSVTINFETDGLARIESEKII